MDTEIIGRMPSRTGSDRPKSKTVALVSPKQDSRRQSAGSLKNRLKTREPAFHPPPTRNPFPHDGCPVSEKQGYVWAGEKPLP